MEASGEEAGRRTSEKYLEEAKRQVKLSVTLVCSNLLFTGTQDN